MAKKSVKTIIKLQIPAGQATPAPPVGTALGPQGLNIQEICQKFNAQTKNQQGFIIPVEITVYQDRTYDMRFKTPPASDLLKKAAGIEKGAAEPHKLGAGKVAKAQIAEIAKKKMADLNTEDQSSAEKIIAGTARSMGIKVE